MDAQKTTPPGGHAAVYDALMWPFERAAVGAWRRRLAARARGRVLEVGAGTGSQLRWYGPGAEVVALEPGPGMVARARRRSGAGLCRVVPRARSRRKPAHARARPLAVAAGALAAEHGRPGMGGGGRGMSPG